MKKFFSILASLFITSVVLSQTVTINTTGNRNKQISIDSKVYTITNTTATDEQSIVINDLAQGQHSLEVIRTNQYNTRVSTRTYFTVREGYDLTITINSNGAVSTSETRIGAGNNAIRPISTAAFNKLYSQTKAKSSSTTRTTLLENEFTNTNKRFTSKQASQLIKLVNSESMRFKLAKLSYPRITDRQNFNLVSNLLNSTSNKNELSNYIATLNLDDDDLAASDVGVPMTDAKFRTIYNEAYAETSSDRYYYLSNFFGKNFNYYTSYQAAQLIQLAQSEEERFNLAKTAYRGVTDRENYSTVSQLLSSSANRTALAAYINTYNSTNTNVGIAMSTTAFNNLYNSVLNDYNSASRYAAINQAFTSSANYFTVAQAKKLIPLVSAESSRLLLAKTVYPRLTDRGNYLQFNEFLFSSANRNDLYNYVVNYNNSYGGTVGLAMSEANYNKLYQDVSNAWSQSTRLSIEAEAFRNTNNLFMVEQVRRLLLLMSSENDRLTLAKNAFDNTVDQSNYSLLYDVFSTTAYRNDLANFIAAGGVGTGTGVLVAMSESEYNSMYKSVQYTFGFGAKMSSLTDIFNTATNYFTANQAKELVRLVSSESNRLELAKLSYNNIVDPENFNVMYDVLTSESSKTELRNFVSTNPSIGQ
jgi:hypothetical protein